MAAAISIATLKRRSAAAHHFTTSAFDLPHELGIGGRTGQLATGTRRADKSGTAGQNRSTFRRLPFMLYARIAP